MSYDKNGNWRGGVWAYWPKHIVDAQSTVRPAALDYHDPEVDLLEPERAVPDNNLSDHEAERACRWENRS
jgi:hypothetical protein